MSKTNENAPRTEAHDDVIVLGVASIETKGTALGNAEGFGQRPMPGISEE